PFANSGVLSNSQSIVPSVLPLPSWKKTRFPLQFKFGLMKPGFACTVPFQSSLPVPGFWLGDFADALPVGNATSVAKTKANPSFLITDLAMFIPPTSVAFRVSSPSRAAVSAHSGPVFRTTSAPASRWARPTWRSPNDDETLQKSLEQAR